MGIGLLLLSVAFFFKYSIDQGWLTEWVRLAIGVMAGITLVILGFKGASKGEPLGTALAGGGIATFFITGFVGHQWYELVSYPMAFGFLVAVSGLGIFLALRSGLQALAMVGLIGALATPLLLTAPRPDVVGLALYVSLIVASVAAIYMARAWRALLLMAVVTAWLVLSIAVGQVAGSTAGFGLGGSGWNRLHCFGVLAGPALPGGIEGSRSGAVASTGGRPESMERLRALGGPSRRPLPPDASGRGHVFGLALGAEPPATWMGLPRHGPPGPGGGRVDLPDPGS